VGAGRVGACPRGSERQRGRACTPTTGSAIDRARAWARAVEGSRGAAAIEELRVMGAVVVWWVCVVVWGAKRTERNAAAPPRPECPHQFITAAGEEARTEGRTDEADDDGWMDG
jgi:hypothetical protein